MDLVKDQYVNIRSFKTKLVRKIYGPICDRGEWRIKYNSELYRLYTVNLLKWLHLLKFQDYNGQGMCKEWQNMRYPRKLWEINLKEKGVQDDQGYNRWMGGFLEDLRKLRIQGWWLVARDREAWKRVLREAEAQIGL